jgi:hypothetical protein
MKLTTHLQLVLRSRNVDLYIHSPVRLHVVLLNYLSTGTTLPFLIIENYTGHKYRKALQNSDDADADAVVEISGYN